MAMNNYEKHYRQLLSRITNEGIREKVNGHMCYRTFGGQLIVSMLEGFPILTGRKMYVNTFLTEAKWILSGESSTRILKENNVSIWDSYNMDDLGYGMYGPSMRNFNKSGLDQLNAAIDDINSGDNSLIRRVIVVLYNPLARETFQNRLPPPCYTQFQFITYSGNKLLMVVTYRSTDAFVGLPYDVAVFAIILKYVALKTNTHGTKLIIQFGDVHIYEGHLATGKVLEYLETKPVALPKCFIDENLNFELFNYNYQKVINTKPII